MFRITGKSAGSPAFLPIGRGGELHSFRKKLFQYLVGGERLCFLLLLRRLDSLKTPVEEKVVDDLEATGNDEGKAEEG
jgi:hypothetical protein